MNGWLKTVGFLTILYGIFWVTGEHGHSYYLEPAKQQEGQWVCVAPESGPFWDNGKDQPAVCHDPVRQCPVLWFPYASQMPCPYKDPLGGTWTYEDEYARQQMKQLKKLQTRR